MRKTTKQAISESLAKLLETHTIEKITVKEIVADCGVNRQTFYYHFCDIYDLLEWTLDNSFRQFVTEHPVPENDWQEQIGLLQKFFHEHRQLILHAYDSTNRAYYENFMERFLAPIFRYRLSLCPSASSVSEEKRQFVQQVYTWACSNLIIEWVEHGMPEGHLSRLTDYIGLVNATLNAALEHFASDQS